MSKTLNLWEAITSLNSKGEKFTDDDIVELGKSSKWNGQELSLQATEEGWVIRVFSCYSEDGVTGIEILVPKDDGPVKVLKDRNGRLEWHHF